MTLLISALLYLLLAYGVTILITILCVTACLIADKIFIKEPIQPEFISYLYLRSLNPIDLWIEAQLHGFYNTGDRRIAAFNVVLFICVTAIILNLIFGG